MKTLKEKENKIRELKLKRSSEWQKGKSGRSDNVIQECTEKINKLKKEVKKSY